MGKEKLEATFGTTLSLRDAELLKKILRKEGWKSPAEYLRFKCKQDIHRYGNSIHTLKEFVTGENDVQLTRMAPSPNQQAPESIDGQFTDLDFIK